MRILKSILFGIIATFLLAVLIVGGGLLLFYGADLVSYLADYLITFGGQDVFEVWAAATFAVMAVSCLLLGLITEEDNARRLKKEQESQDLESRLSRLERRMETWEPK